ncbi:AAA family ATPase [Mesorhizobium sp. LSJC269B00]|uniref:AAA family ATPase n=1 Tax=Mesorhizobium sp. LSJC269B00 TaxID=1287326 RepID=UPI0003FF81A1|nr:AAA family ATPase [Mesorhizobium sp. LSJC269B00]
MKHRRPLLEVDNDDLPVLYSKQFLGGTAVKLIRFKVENFRSVVDSGWVEAERVTALIGVNESGKTNLLLPLWKLNPAREGEIKPTSDYPKATFNRIQEAPGDYVFITADFECKELAPKIATLTGLDASILDRVEVSRAFDGEFYVSFPKHSPSRLVGVDTLDAVFRTALAEIEAIAPLAKEGTLKPDFIAAIKNASASVEGKVKINARDLLDLAEKLKGRLPPTPATTSSIVPRFMLLIEKLDGIATRLKAPNPGDVEGVEELIVAALPKFVYYSNYGNLDSEIYLPHVVENLKRTDLGQKEAAKARTLRVLFSFVRLQPEQILELGLEATNAQTGTATEGEIAEAAERKRKRTIMLHSAGTELTKEFRDWWKQGDYTFDFQADGNHFRIWVSDARRPEKVELEDRSTGLQWFLSFYLIFLVERKSDLKDTVLLLDEPGLSLHPLAQRDLSAFFENLADTNQIIYTTHSPFLVDADMLDRARKVYLGDDGSTKASADLRRGSEDPRKAGATYAIYSALNMNVAESILFGCLPVIVEGPSDQHYLSTIKMLLISASRINPSREIVFPPSHGAKNAKVVASILSGRDEELPAMLLDGDEIGRKMANDLRNGLYQSAKGRVLSTDAYTSIKDSEIEDLFPPDFLAAVVDRWQRGTETLFADVLKAGEPIVPQIESWAAQQSVLLEDGWKVDLAREVKKRALAQGAGMFDTETLDRWTKLFTDLEKA